MTTTHGTRSAYNRGCRCDACREVSRAARARQREAVRGNAEIPNSYDDGGATTGIGLIPAGLVLLVAGGSIGWAAWRTNIEPDATDAELAARRRHIVLGVLLAAAGVGCVLLSVR